MAGTLTDDYFNDLLDTDRDRVMNRVQDALSTGIPAEEIVFNVVIPALDKMSKLYVEHEQVSISQQFLASRISEEVVDMLIPGFEEQPEKKGMVVIGTGPGDFHGLGKKIVSGYLRANLFNVTDLGLNVPAEKLVDEAVKLNADVIGVSTMMMHTAKNPAGPLKVRELLHERALEDGIKLVVGGAPYQFDDKLYTRVRADAWGGNAIEAVEIIDNLING